MSTVRRAALELAAACIEEVADQLTAALRDASAHPFPTSGQRPYSDESQLPAPEIGDRLSGVAREHAIRSGEIPPADGIVEQDGLTEEEWEERRL